MNFNRQPTTIWRMLRSPNGFVLNVLRWYSCAMNSLVMKMKGSMIKLVSWLNCPYSQSLWCNDSSLFQCLLKWLYRTTLIIKLWNDNLDLLYCIYGTPLLWFNYCAIYNMLIRRIVYLISQFLVCCHVHASQRGGTDNRVQLQCIGCERGYWSFIEFIFWLIWGQFRVTLDLHLWWTWLFVQNVIPWP